MIHNDHLATPQKMTDASGTIVWAADYKPFGEATITVSTITNNLRFPGQYYDAETGLNYNYYRDYNSITGRYIEPDILGLTAGTNLYRYASNNPLIFSDFYGLFHYKDGVPPAGAEVEAKLRCMDRELKTDLGISGGGECTEPHNITNTSRGHCAGKAADISDRMNPGLNIKDIICAAKKCQFKYAKYEQDKQHVDVKTHTDIANSSGDISKYNCDCPK